MKTNVQLVYSYNKYVVLFRRVTTRTAQYSSPSTSAGSCSVSSPRRCSSVSPRPSSPSSTPVIRATKHHPTFVTRHFNLPVNLTFPKERERLYSKLTGLRRIFLRRVVMRIMHERIFICNVQRLLLFLNRGFKLKCRVTLSCKIIIYCLLVSC